MADDIAWAIAYVEEDAEACSAVNGERDGATKEARRLEVVVKRLAREREEAAARIAELEAEVARLRSAWQPIETAPNDADILVAYDDGSVDFIEAADNDYDFKPYAGPAGHGISSPTHWMPPLPPPALAAPDTGEPK